MGKRYQLLESWHNGCDNAVDEVFCESDHKENLEEILASVCDELKTKGLGYDFPSGTPQLGVDGPGNPVLFLGKDISISEHWRSFRIAETEGN